MWYIQSKFLACTKQEKYAIIRIKFIITGSFTVRSQHDSHFSVTIGYLGNSKQQSHSLLPSIYLHWNAVYCRH